MSIMTIQCICLVVIALYRQKAAAIFVEAGIPTLLIADCAVGTFMERVDLCIVGAEGVMENGGVVNKVPKCYFVIIYDVVMIVVVLF